MSAPSRQFRPTTAADVARDGHRFEWLKPDGWREGFRALVLEVDEDVRRPVAVGGNDTRRRLRRKPPRPGAFHGPARGVEFAVRNQADVFLPRIHAQRANGQGGMGGNVGTGGQGVVCGQQKNG